MKTLDSIKICLYPGEHRDELLVGNIAGYGIPMEQWNSEEELSLLLERCREQGYDTKEVLVLKPFKGRFFQSCPGSPHMICCNYLLLNTCFGCFFDCTYCFLLSYLNSFGIMQFFPMDNLIDELPSALPPEDGMIRRLGTGEFTDSIMMDHVTGIASRVMDVMRARPDVFVEFKTKSAAIDHLLEMDIPGNAVLAWSLNTEHAVSHYEKDSASLDERLEAALRAQEAGFRLAFHFDPVIMYPGFLEEYKKLVHRLLATVNPDNIVWISMGCFRYVPAFRESMRKRFPREDLSILDEMVPGRDGKMRYLKEERVAVYRELNTIIRKKTDYPFVYLCMETDDIWREAMDMELDSSDHLEKVFSDHLRKWFISPVHGTKRENP